VNKLDFVSETERLVIRPYQKNDYRNWLNQYQNRLPSQHKYDEGKIDMSEYTEEWFNDWVEKLQ
jgi:ribosomal-protein-alanine N-acetyltransferase